MEERWALLDSSSKLWIGPIKGGESSEMVEVAEKRAELQSTKVMVYDTETKVFERIAREGLDGKRDPGSRIDAVGNAMTVSKYVKLCTARGDWPRQLYQSNNPQAKSPYIIATGFDSPPLNAKHVAILELNELGCSAEKTRLLSDGSNEVWIQSQRAKPIRGRTQSAPECTREDLVDVPETMEIGEVAAIPEMVMVYDHKRKMLSMVPAKSFDCKRKSYPCKDAIAEILLAKKYVKTFAPAYNWPLDLYMSDEAKPEDRYAVVPHTKEVPQDVAGANWRRIAEFTLRYRGDSASSLYGLAAVSQILWIGPVEETDRQDQVGSKAGLGIAWPEKTVNLPSMSSDTFF